ncbi:ATP-binding protein [Sphaerisporangium sp. NPDC005288]|uniref:ATP-binding protein n=1 Tax=Sphaerisporangium sp. NPDC005288 TaxID=3155114 RepID=UPI0033AFBF41
MSRDAAPPAPARGRHRPGVAPTLVPSRRWDAAERAAAQQLDQMEPVWAIWYGVGSRRFYAVATWPLPAPLALQAGTADELRNLMREAERVVLFPLVPDHPTPPAAADRLGRRPFHPALPSRPTPDGAPMPPTRDGGLRTACWDLTDDLSMIGEARRAVKETLISWALPELTDDVVLAVGELLANAVSYGEPPVRLSLWLGTRALCVRVTDHGPELPRHLDLDVEAVHGRGLTIVDALADDTGVTPFPDGEGKGKTVWCRWHLTTPAADTSHAG